MDVVEIEISSPELLIYPQMAWAGVSQEDRSPSAPSKAHKYRKKKNKKEAVAVSERKAALLQCVETSDGWSHPRSLLLEAFLFNLWYLDRATRRYLAR